jgi:hypothetical protein
MSTKTGYNIEQVYSSVSDYADQMNSKVLKNKKKYTGRVFIENWDIDSTLYH